MKISIQIVILTALFSFSTRSFAQKKKETISVQTSAQCDMCKNAIEKQLIFKKGVQKANLNTETGVATITYKPTKINARSIYNAITEIGYDANNHPADSAAYENLHFCCKKKEE